MSLYRFGSLIKNNKFSKVYSYLGTKDRYVRLIDACMRHIRKGHKIYYTWFLDFCVADDRAIHNPRVRSVRF